MTFYFLDICFNSYIYLQVTGLLSTLIETKQIYYQMVGISFVIFFGAVLKIFFTKKNLLLLMLGIELMMLGIIFFVLSSFNSICFLNPYNFLITFSLLTLVISESVIGLILVLLLSKRFGSIDLSKLNKLKG